MSSLDNNMEKYKDSCTPSTEIVHFNPPKNSTHLLHQPKVTHPAKGSTNFRMLRQKQQTPSIDFRHKVKHKMLTLKYLQNTFIVKINKMSTIWIQVFEINYLYGNAISRAA